jgi:alpha-tubulin suppressor-like RCC1 family protein
MCQVRRALVVLGALAVLAGCKDETAPLDLAGPPAAVSIVAGEGQHGVAGAALGSALMVRVTDSDGRPSPGARVAWTASAGSLSSDATETNETGQSGVTWTLPAVPGVYTARATAEGVGDLLFTATAQPVAGNIVFRYLDAGGYHACGITTTEQLLCWGYGADGQLGLGNTSPVLSPTLIPGDFRYRRIASGFYHTCAFTLAANAYCWGNNSDGRLGFGGSGGSSTTPVAVTIAPTVDTLHGDTLVIGGVELLVQGMAAGEAHTCGVDLAQRLFCWGRNSEGQLGRGDFSGFNPPTLVNSGELFKEVSVGGLHTCGITLAGTGRCWGYNVAGQLGDGSTANSAMPVAVAGGATFRTDPLVIFHSPDPDFPLPPGPFVAAGYDHSCAISVAGPTLCWGLNEYGQLGEGTTSNRTTPAVVAGGHAFAAITAGLRHTCALDTTGAAFCWGDNTYGELGDGTNTRRSSPVAVAGSLSFAFLKAGELSTCGVTSAGVAYCWGDNEYGQLGTGTTTASSAPVKVAFQP